MSDSINTSSNLMIVGWREWVALPELGIEKIKAKIDTGARTSALHAFHIETFQKDAKEHVRFKLHPFRHHKEIIKICTAEIIDKRMVKDSGGHAELRYVIRTSLVLGSQQWSIEITLTDRESMYFRMLLGRSAMINRVMVSPENSYRVSKDLKKR